MKIDGLLRTIKFEVEVLEMSEATPHSKGNSCRVKM